ncbi:hypothetical protein L3i20_v233320 [Paenibacillus sp. L3-i20]|nr:hypothetical protein L3i20_v233320 [Paenibacillus sp. L3-i20]
MNTVKKSLGNELTGVGLNKYNPYMRGEIYMKSVKKIKEQKTNIF